MPPYDDIIQPGNTYNPYNPATVRVPGTRRTLSRPLPVRGEILTIPASSPADTPHPASDRQPDDTLTIIAIAIAVYVLSDVFHEGVGHGGACLLVGGRPLVLSTVHFDCTAGGRIVAAGGTVANLVLGVVCWLWSRHTRAPRARYFLWLAMTVNFFEVGGYFLFSGVGNIGDWADVIAGLQPAWSWRVGLTLLGAATYMAFVWFALIGLRPFLADSTAERVYRARRLCLVPYLSGGILSCVAGLFNPVGMILVAISAAASSLGGTSGLAWMWQLLRAPRPVSQSPPVAPIARSNAWIVAGVVLAVVFIGVLGRGISFDPALERRAARPFVRPALRTAGGMNAAPTTTVRICVPVSFAPVSSAPSPLPRLLCSRLQRCRLQRRRLQGGRCGLCGRAATASSRGRKPVSKPMRGRNAHTW